MSTAMDHEPRYRPILMSTPMATAVLERRKTETRRIVKPDIAHILSSGSPAERELILEECPYGIVGDRLWARETWRLEELNQHAGPRLSLSIEYKAGGHGVNLELTDDKDREQAYRAMKHGSAWRPGIHMPRWACRMVLQLTEVRAERLKFINENGVRAEGLQQCTKDGMLYKWGWEGLPWTDWHEGGAVKAFSSLWDGLNAGRGYPWAENPWVWVLCFKYLEGEG